jgi:hypothetical protein
VIGDGKNPEPGSGIRDEHPDLIFENLVSVFCVRFLFFDADLVPGSSILSTMDLGSGMEKIGSGIWDKHPGSAKLLLQFTFVLILLFLIVYITTN